MVDKNCRELCRALDKRQVEILKALSNAQVVINEQDKRIKKLEEETNES